MELIRHAGCLRLAVRMPTNTATVDFDLLRRIEGGFHEMPGITLAEAQRRWKMSLALEALAEELTKENLLARTRRGALVRAFSL
jgi:hypothetical protein